MGLSSQTRSPTVTKITLLLVTNKTQHGNSLLKFLVGQAQVSTTVFLMIIRKKKTKQNQKPNQENLANLFSLAKVIPLGQVKFAMPGRSLEWKSEDCTHMGLQI